MPAVAKETNEVIKIKRRKKKSRLRIKPRVLNLKGWFKTPEDWERFNEWAKVNAQPRKLPDPEPIVRPAKPLRHFQKRLKALAEPNEACSSTCVIRGVSKAALNYKASKQLRCLAQPKVRLGDFGCQQWKIKKSSLLYEASDAIVRLARPTLRPDSGDCKSSHEVSRSALKRKPTDTDQRLAMPKRYNATECVERKVVVPDCEQQLSPWIEFLALPNYRVLMNQNTENAEKWKQQIFVEIEARGKQAYEEQVRRREKAGDPIPQRAEETSNEDGENEGGEEVNEEEDEEARKQRRMEKEAWRFQEISCKEYPAKISEAALNYKATTNMAIMALPKTYEPGMCRNFYEIKKSALTIQASPAIEILARPKHQCDPVQRPPPREKDQFGQPIFPKPVYEKRLPRVKRYEPRECPEKIEAEETSEEPDDLEHVRPISRIAFEATIDPLFDPIAAKKQIKERKRFEELQKAMEAKAAAEGKKGDQEGGEEEAEEKTAEETHVEEDEAAGGDGDGDKKTEKLKIE